MQKKCTLFSILFLTIVCVFNPMQASPCFGRMSTFGRVLMQHGALRTFASDSKVGSKAVVRNFNNVQKGSSRGTGFEFLQKNTDCVPTIMRSRDCAFAAMYFTVDRNAQQAARGFRRTPHGFEKIERI